LLKYPERGYETTAGRREKEIFICDKCGHENSKWVYQMAYQGFSCEQCSDGISYPEKFFASLLNQIGIEYEKQKVFEWSKEVTSDWKSLCGFKKYDFYISSFDCIIEVHGIQHHEESFKRIKGARSLIEEQENDRLKKELAINNKIKHYIVID
jgi:hypothetical protein